MRENYFENKLRLKVNAIGALCLKFESPGFTGVPDRIILLPHGKVIFVETKKPGEKERMRQMYVHGVLRKFGFEVFNTVDSLEKIDNVVCRCKEVMNDAGI